ncbi:Fms-interacting protein-domain-containing protein [Thelephora terrestris]|uniref:Fms-interacting protein-domain-containing protein n=1 Tax=Thelephora terrestris TaxID=56493 RepID=A0A9P6L4W6_9AGAM|nr:Fms-interacting protein-domain-containing protein [Thelephora terrestris]
MLDHDQDGPDTVVQHLHGLTDPSTITNYDPQVIQTRAMALFGQLKAHNRAANAQTRSHKQATADARTQMDQAHLVLQNLLYEKRHLEREIEKCRQFASMHQDIPLYSMELFTILAPDESKTEEILNDPHQLIINRLNFELSERQRLDRRKKELQQQKDVLIKETKDKVAAIDNVRQQLDIFLKAATEAQKKVDDLIQPLQPSGSSTQGSQA